MNAIKKSVLAKNAILLPGCDISSKELLLKFPHGAYTAARTVGLDRILEYQTHVNRLGKSYTMIRQREEPSFELPLDGVNGAVRKSLKTAVAHFKKEYPEHQRDDLKLSVVLTDMSEHMNTSSSEDPAERQVLGLGNLDLYVHVSILPPRPSHPVAVEIRGQGRSDPLAKDAQWVNQRQSIESLMSSDANESILASEDGSLLEGTQSNFYVIMNNEIHTAGEGILEGTVRRVLLDVCRENNIKVVLRAPTLQSIDKWEGALVSSTSRLALPIDEIRMTRENQRYDKATDYTRNFPVNPESLSMRIEDLVRKAIMAHSEPIFD